MSKTFKSAVGIILFLVVVNMANSGGSKNLFPMTIVLSLIAFLMLLFVFNRRRVDKISFALSHSKSLKTFKDQMGFTRFLLTKKRDLSKPSLNTFTLFGKFQFPTSEDILEWTQGGTKRKTYSLDEIIFIGEYTRSLIGAHVLLATSDWILLTRITKNTRGWCLTPIPESLVLLKEYGGFISLTKTKDNTELSKKDVLQYTVVDSNTLNHPSLLFRCYSSPEFKINPSSTGYFILKAFLNLYSPKLDKESKSFISSSQMLSELSLPLLNKHSVVLAEVPFVDKDDSKNRPVVIRGIDKGVLEVAYVTSTDKDSYQEYRSLNSSQWNIGEGKNGNRSWVAVNGPQASIKILPIDVVKYLGVVSRDDVGKLDRAGF